ncbi:MAG: phosphoesterase, partial [Chloroflexi bacterium]
LLPNFSHVFVIVMENQEITDVIGNSSAPYLNGLANSNALGTQVYAISHPSLPNYLALAGGSTYGVTTDCTTCYVSGSNLADQIEASGRTFRAYLEGMPSPCFVGDSYPYMQKHNPWIYFDDMRTNATRCAADLVPYSQLSTDLTNNTVPNFVWITPNMCNDMHDCSIASGDAWLSQQVPAILNSAAFKNGGVLFLTWDEGNTYAACCTDAAGGRVATIVVSPLGKTAYQSSVPETLYGLLRTIEDAWSLPELGDASCSCTTVMREYFR